MLLLVHRQITLRIRESRVVLHATLDGSADVQYTAVNLWLIALETLVENSVNNATISCRHISEWTFIIILVLHNMLLHSFAQLFISSALFNSLTKMGSYTWKVSFSNFNFTLFRWKRMRKYRNKNKIFYCNCYGLKTLCRRVDLTVVMLVLVLQHIKLLFY